MAQLKSTKVFGDLNVTGEVNVSTKITVNGNEVWDVGNLLDIGTTAETARAALGLGAGATRWPTFAEVTGKPSTYAPSGHTHPWAQITGQPDTATRWPAVSEVTGLDSALAGKVDKVAGKGLSDANFTQAEKTKLASLESSKFVGLFVSESALPTTGSAGDYANVDGGVGSDVYRVMWDTSDKKWVRIKGVSTELTPAQIKQQYEGNPDTNAYTDAEKTKLSGIAAGAQVNVATNLGSSGTGATRTITSSTGSNTSITYSAADVGAVPTARTITAGTGLSGGGNLTANRTLSVNYGTAAGTAAQGNDSRINNGQTAFGWGNHASAGYVKTDTTYTAGAGLTLSGNAFSLPVTLSGSGTFVQSVTQIASGITITLGTPPNTNTTYAEIPEAEVTTGTAATLRTISGRRLKQAVDEHGLKIGTTATTAKAGNWVPSWNDVTSKPATATRWPSTTEVTGLTDALNSKAALRSTSTADGGLKTRIESNTLWITNNGTDA